MIEFLKVYTALKALEPTLMQMDIAEIGTLFIMVMEAWAQHNDTDALTNAELVLQWMRCTEGRETSDETL